MAGAGAVATTATSAAGVISAATDTSVVAPAIREAGTLLVPSVVGTAKTGYSPDISGYHSRYVDWTPGTYPFMGTLLMLLASATLPIFSPKLHLFACRRNYCFGCLGSIRVEFRTKASSDVT